MKIAVFGKYFNDEYSSSIQYLFEQLELVEAKIKIYQPFAEYLQSKIEIKSGFHYFSNASDLNDTDFVFSIGGDGTVLEAANLVRDTQIPIMGINTGRLGFLSSIATTEIDEAIKAIKTRTYKIDNRTLLELETNNKLFGNQNFALNELTIHKKDSSSMITIHAYVDNSFLNSYWADGLIISTPTGSTAYSLSCGGPIIAPRSGNFVINPVAPHNLNVRPLVVPDTSAITLIIEGRAESFLVSLDSRSEIIESSIELTVKKCDFETKLLRMPDYNYLNTIRGKLNWGLDKRN